MTSGMQTDIDKSPTFEFTGTQDWFSGNIDTWRDLLKHVIAPQPRALEIGSWEGRSAVFLLTELCRSGGEVVCIDHFDLMATEVGRERRRKLDHNLSITGKPFRIIDEFSVPGLMTLLNEEMSVENPGFDWIYVDGSHEADDTFLDGELAWRLARKGAIMVFDDYHWDKEPEDSVHHPKRGIDSFMALHAGQFTRLSSETQYQMVLQKHVDMRIGFLAKERAEPSGESLKDALGYGINVVLTIDAGYAIAAAVALRSAATHTPGRVTFYVVGRDLSQEVQAKLQQSVSGSSTEKTLVFIDLPNPLPHLPPDVVFPDGVTWAKIGMISLLPVERVLYMDADVLIRGDLKALWDTDLGGKAIAAAPDVGLPMGHDSDGVRDIQYFNAGVMLLDLSVVRRHAKELYALAAKMRGSRFKDQDALNVHFRDNWHPLSLRWNAQGLGTYARYHIPERATLSLGEMEGPSIVHFTGALHPSLAEVINPFVQPYTAKPWGYAGSPGHPYAEEWWKVCEETPWHGWRLSAEYKKDCEGQADKAVSEGVAAFRSKMQELSH